MSAVIFVKRDINTLLRLDLHLKSQAYALIQRNKSVVLCDATLMNVLNMFVFSI